MIPTLEDIIRMLANGDCSSEQAMAWLKAHDEGKAEALEADRRFFAAMAMQGLCSYSGEDAGKWSCDQVARKSRQMADALIAELGRTED